MITFDTYKQYFSNIQQNSLSLLGTEIASFGYGDSDRIIEKLRSKIEYPILWAERPEYNTFYNAGWYVDIDGSFTILFGLPKDKPTEQDTAINNAMELAQKILHQMYINGYLTAKSRIEPLDKVTADNGYGVRVTFFVPNKATTFLCS